MAAPSSSPQAQAQRKRRVLIADDNAYYLTIIGNALAEGGYEITAISDGFAAMEALGQGHVGFDLAILNRELPGLSGMDIVRKTRQELGNTALIMLLMDVFTKKGAEIEELKSSGASGYFNKSIPIEEIVYRINDLLFPPQRFSRKNPRAVVYLPVRFLIGEQQNQSYSFTLSGDGMYIQSMAPPAPRTEMAIQFKLPDGHEVRVKGRVLYRYKYDPHRNRSVLPGMAVLFLDVGADDRARINKFVVDTLVTSVRAQKEVLGADAQASGNEQIVTCRMCTGLGKISYVTCNACGGTGKGCGLCRNTGFNPFIRKVCPDCHGVGSLRAG